jgi:hypothetical protein
VACLVWLGCGPDRAPDTYDPTGGEDAATDSGSASDGGALADGGNATDAGSPDESDSGNPEGVDAGALNDAGPSEDDAGPGEHDAGSRDAGHERDGGPHEEDAGTADAGPETCTPPSATLTATAGSTPVTAAVPLDTTVELAAHVTGGSSAVAGYAWSLTSAPGGNTSQISSHGGSATLDCTVAGTYVVSVVAHDSDGCTSEPATFSIGVTSTLPTCGSAEATIFVVDESSVLYSFSPSTLAFTSLGAFSCNTTSTVNTMAVDGQGTAWVEYQDGELFKVNTTTLACTATSFSTTSVTSDGWGSCFATNEPSGTGDTFYIAENSELQTINTTTLAVSTVATITGITSTTTLEPELTSTTSGELYGLFPSPWTVGLINRTTGAVTNTVAISLIATDVPTAGNWAFASSGSDFWIFAGGGTSTDVFHLTSTGTTLATSTTAAIVGASPAPCVTTGG